MRRWILIVGLLLGVPALAFGISLTKATLPLTALPPMTVPVATPPEGMTLKAIHAGSMESEAVFAYRGGSLGDKRTFAMGGILVQHPRGDLLFDTGFGRNIDEHVQGAPLLMRLLTHYRKEAPVADQLKAAGIDPKNLRGVVLTHAHWDHVSGLDDLREVPVLVTRAELDFIHSGDRMTRLIRSFGDLRYEVYDFPGGPYLGFDRSYDFFADGSVVLVPAPGHTPGSIIAFITLPGGRRYALVGDAVWQREAVDLPAERPWVSRRLVDKDDVGLRDVIVRLHQLKARFPDLIIVPAHDERVWQTLPRLEPALPHGGAP